MALKVSLEFNLVKSISHDNMHVNSIIETVPCVYRLNRPHRIFYIYIILLYKGIRYLASNTKESECGVDIALIMYLTEIIQNLKKLCREKV